MQAEAARGIYGGGDGEGDADAAGYGARHGRGVIEKGVGARPRRPTGPAIPPNRAGDTEWSGLVLYSRGMVQWLARPDPVTHPGEELMAAVSVPARAAPPRRERRAGESRSTATWPRSGGGIAPGRPGTGRKPCAVRCYRKKGKVPSPPSGPEIPLAPSTLCRKSYEPNSIE